MSANELWDELARLVDETCSLLRDYDNEFWVSWLRSRHAALRADGAAGAERFTEGWGGMGGFLDLVIYRLDGQPMPAAEVDAVNRRLHELQGGLYRTAKRIGERG